MADINVGNNANLLKGAIDSHDTTNNVNNVDNSVTNNVVNNTTNSTTNHSTVYEAQKTMQEITQQNENEFLLAVQERYADGMLSPQEMAELQQIALKWKIAPMRANQIIDQVRKSMEMIQGGQGSEFLAGQILNEVFNAIQANEVEILKRKFRTLEQVAKTSADSNVQFYCNLLFASLSPENCTVAFINSRTDNYWQLYWAHVAYVKLGNIDNATVLLPRLGGFGCPQGDTALLMAIDNIAEYRKNNKQPYYQQQAGQYLDQACQLGMSEQLSSLWYATQEMLKEEQTPEEWFRFYCETTLKELAPVKAPALPKSAPQIPTPPPVPKFNAQNVNLQQMQGFNPLQAAKQMGLGQMPSMQQTQQQITGMGAQMMGGMSQMPGKAAPAAPPMPNAPSAMPPMPNAPSAMPPMPNAQAGEKSALVVPEAPLSAEPENRIPQYGIIFTDSLALAEKYGCEPQDVYDVVNDFTQSAAEADMHWYLLDAGNYRDSIDREYWGDYNEMLANYIYENGFQVGVATPVFIIGGSDVIPVPQLENPQWGGRMIPTDLAYCFYTTFFSDLWEGDRSIGADNVRNTVSRLPLETGTMETTLYNDLQSYFNLCSIFADGIDVPGVAMASNVDWTANSVTMSQHLPLLHQRKNDERQIYKGMYMCPKLVTNDNGAGVGIDQQALSDYKEALDKAGMLLFNLHGSDTHGDSGFFCNGGGGYPESFNIELMKQSNARVFNTVACFGARYDGYQRNDSMLMSALLGGGKMLYAGSTVSVPMIGDDEQTYPAGVTQYPGSGSEKFMPLYCYYQFCGLPAGQAMMQAKLDYFGTFRHIERDDFSLSTIMMFGLYGNPMLRVKKRGDVIEAAQQYEVLPQLPEMKAANAPVRMARKSCLISKQQLQESKSLLDQIRGCVDQNLTAIHSIVTQNLYQTLGLDPRWLEQVDAYQWQNYDGDGDIDSGYVYYYDADNKHGRKSMVEVNKQGQMTRKVTYK